MLLYPKKQVYVNGFLKFILKTKKKKKFTKRKRTKNKLKRNFDYNLDKNILL